MITSSDFQRDQTGLSRSYDGVPSSNCRSDGNSYIVQQEWFEIPENYLALLLVNGAFLLLSKAEKLSKLGYLGQTGTEMGAPMA